MPTAIREGPLGRYLHPGVGRGLGAPPRKWGGEESFAPMGQSITHYLWFGTDRIQCRSLQRKIPSYLTPTGLPKHPKEGIQHGRLYHFKLERIDNWR